MSFDSGGQEYSSETEQSGPTSLSSRRCNGIWNSDPFHVFHEIKMRNCDLKYWENMSRYIFDNCYNIYVHQYINDPYLGSKIIGGYGYFSNWICLSAVHNEQPFWSEQPDRLVTIFSHRWSLQIFLKFNKGWNQGLTKVRKQQIDSQHGSSITCTMYNWPLWVFSFGGHVAITLPSSSTINIDFNAW